MRKVFIILRQNTKGDKDTYSTGTSYATRDIANSRKDTLERQARIVSADRNSKPKFWVEPITVSEE